MNGFIKVAVFNYQHEYAILQLLLEQAEIRFFFQNETVLGVMPFYSNAVGGIILKVHPEDLEEAHQIIDDFKTRENLRTV
ncbi:DUF2007 domain-containing protein [Psychroflexus planctonicus]|uniref:Signal transducing protein n=1 Tax=Psychroflexus planctonicus TaxID=1526575 RepID=A0ABQ1SF11_9FLAO|nr:DUF2007 domain-containing protein [Psychroflexus planctonicus]GGE35369.1 hypothetical protein GCM10010832_14420 [Psychroflexus planctonicus]